MSTLPDTTFVASIKSSNGIHVVQASADAVRVSAVATQTAETVKIEPETRQVLTEEVNAAPVVIGAEGPQVIAVGRNSMQVVVAGIRGRPGKDSVGSGVTYVQDFEPVGALDKESWYNPLTFQMKVYSDGAWRPVAPDGGYF